MRNPKVVYKYRSWDDIQQRGILLNNEIYFTSPKEFNDPFDCRIVENFHLIEKNEADEFITERVEFMLQGKLMTKEEIQKEIEFFQRKFINRSKFQHERELKSYEQQDNHYGILSLSSRWNSILMWSHYAAKHKGFCVGFYEEKLRNYLFSKGHLIKGGQVSYTKAYPKLKPIAKYDPDYALKLGFVQTHSKAEDWEHEKEYRIVKTVFPKAINPQDRRVTFPSNCISEIILGICISKEDKKVISDICSRKNIKIYQAHKVPFQFKISRSKVS